MKKLTLVEKAKNISKRKSIDGLQGKEKQEFQELALAWLKNEVNMGQCVKVLLGEKALRHKKTNVIYSFAYVFRELYATGKLKINSN